VVNNLSADPQIITLQIPGAEKPGLTDLWSGESVTPGADGEIHLDLAPYQYLWLNTAARGS
jgi:hypothetical protein